MILLAVQYLMNFMSLLVWKNEDDEGWFQFKFVQWLIILQHHVVGHGRNGR